MASSAYVERQQWNELNLPKPKAKSCVISQTNVYWILHLSKYIPKKTAVLSLVCFNSTLNLSGPIKPRNNANLFKIGYKLKFKFCPKQTSLTNTFSLTQHQSSLLIIKNESRPSISFHWPLCSIIPTEESVNPSQKHIKWIKGIHKV